MAELKQEKLKDPPARPPRSKRGQGSKIWEQGKIDLSERNGISFSGPEQGGP